MKITIDLRDAERLAQRWEEPAIVGKPMKTFYEATGLHIRNLAVAGAPHDRNRLRGSIKEQVDDSPIPTQVTVGSNVEYAPYMEYGTGLFAEGPKAKGGRHWPPAAALDLWAERHGWASGAQVAAIIGKRGGLLPRRYLRNALADSLGEIASNLAQLARDIAARMAGK